MPSGCRCLVWFGSVCRSWLYPWVGSLLRHVAALARTMEGRQHPHTGGWAGPGLRWVTTPVETPLGCQRSPSCPQSRPKAVHVSPWLSPYGPGTRSDLLEDDWVAQSNALGMSWPCLLPCLFPSALARLTSGAQMGRRGTNPGLRRQQLLNLAALSPFQSSKQTSKYCTVPVCPLRLVRACSGPKGLVFVTFTGALPQTHFAARGAPGTPSYRRNILGEGGYPSDKKRANRAGKQPEGACNQVSAPLQPWPCLHTHVGPCSYSLSASASVYPPPQP